MIKNNLKKLKIGVITLLTSLILGSSMFGFIGCAEPEKIIDENGNELATPYNYVILKTGKLYTLHKINNTDLDKYYKEDAEYKTRFNKKFVTECDLAAIEKTVTKTSGSSYVDGYRIESLDGKIYVYNPEFSLFKDKENAEEAGYDNLCSHCFNENAIDEENLEIE